jgi:hypothetical protein
MPNLDLKAFYLKDSWVIETIILYCQMWVIETIIYLEYLIITGTRVETNIDGLQ